MSELEYAEILSKRKRNPRLPVYRESGEAPTRKVESRRKYGNKKTEYQGIIFDSKKECERYKELQLLERVGAIKDLKLQVPFVFELNGVKICTYKADFTYLEGRKRIVEDTKGGTSGKGTRTREYMIKKKLLRAFYLQEIRET